MNQVDVKPIVKEEVEEFPEPPEDINFVDVDSKTLLDESDDDENEEEYEPTYDPLALINPRRDKSPIDLSTQGATCPVCQKTFNDKNRHYLKRHIRLVHEAERPYQCSKCGKSFKKLDHLKRHSRLVHEESWGRPYACEKCGKTFKLDEQLKIHLKSHEEADPYTCSICQASYRQKRSFESHLLTHAPKTPKTKPGLNAILIKSFHCSVCNRAFALKKQMRYHQTRMHERATPYSCTRCTRTFKWRQNLRRHTLIAHTGSEEKKKSRSTQQNLITTS